MALGINKGWDKSPTYADVDALQRKIDRQRDLLKQVVDALNSLPNKKLHHPIFKDTYGICSAIDKHLKQ